MPRSAPSYVGNTAFSLGHDERMSEHSNGRLRSDDGSAALDEIRRLRTENGSLKREIAQRERALGDLNRRLLALERSHSSGTSQNNIAFTSAAVESLRARIDELEAEVGVLQTESQDAKAETSLLADEIERIYSTKIFRYASPFRRVYGHLRRLS